MIDIKNATKEEIINRLGEISNTSDTFNETIQHNGNLLEFECEFENVDSGCNLIFRLTTQHDCLGEYYANVIVSSKGEFSKISIKNLIEWGVSAESLEQSRRLCEVFMFMLSPEFLKEARYIYDRRYKEQKGLQIEKRELRAKLADLEKSKDIIDDVMFKIQVLETELITMKRALEELK